MSAKSGLSIHETVSIISQIRSEFSQKYGFDIPIKKIIKKFHSKKHTVILIEVRRNKKWKHGKFHSIPNKLVVKIFNTNMKDWKQRKENEVVNFDFCRKICPEYISKRFFITDTMVFYRFIHGKTIQELYLGSMLTQEHIFNLIKCILTIHKKNRIFGDARLNNFLIYNKNPIIVDFEEMGQGIPFEDFSNLLISFLDLNPGIFNSDLNDYQINCVVFSLQQYIKQIEEYDFVAERFSEDIHHRHFWEKKICDALQRTIDRRKMSDLSNNIFSKINLILEKADFLKD